MNLIPIDSASVPEVAEPQAKSGVDFAALMAGLMSGDTQIAPVIDIPLTDAQPAIGDGAGQSADTDPLLEFIGAPGIALGKSALAMETGDVEGNATADPDAGFSSEVDDHALDADPASGTPALHVASASLSAPDQATAQVADVAATSTVQATLASVHPIRSETASEAPDHAPDGTTRSTTPPGRIIPEPSTEVTDRTRLESVSAIRTSAVSVTSAPRGGAPTVDGPIQVAAESPDDESQLDAGAWIRSSEQTGRPASLPDGAAMVGIARRVEQAIAALATKPDPRIVTLQLDELDGVRLTVALRADGIHLSSTGDASLTADIERALASRGFDMASDARGRQRESSRDAADDGWKPQPAGQRRRTDQPGITL